jgi:hypothetical protein
MSQKTVRHEIATLNHQADRFEARVNDPAGGFSEESHREHLRREAVHLRTTAAREQEQFEKRLASRRQASR